MPKGAARRKPIEPSGGSHGLRLLHVGLALGGTGAAAALLLIAVVWGGLVLLGVKQFRPEEQLTPAVFFDLLKIAFAVVAGLGALVALVMAYRRQKVAEAAQFVAENAEARAHQAEQREATKLHNERFATAAGQLGHSSRDRCIHWREILRQHGRHLLCRGILEQVYS